MAFNPGQPMDAAEIRLPITNLAGDSGASCASCARRVEQKLLGLPGVIRAHVDPTRAFATIGYDPARARLQDLREAIRQAGCGVVRWERAVLRLRPGGSR